MMREAILARPQRASLRPEPGALEPDVDVGIVILSYNTVELLHACLAALLRVEWPTGHDRQAEDQDGRALRCAVCVVDNASTDGSAAMVRAEFPEVHLVVNSSNVGYPAGNNAGLRWLGFGVDAREDRNGSQAAAQARRRDVRGADVVRPRYALLLNPDTVASPAALAALIAFMDARPEIGVVGPRVRRPDGSLDLACRRSFPTPAVSAYHMTRLSRLFPQSQRFNAYNLTYLPEEDVYPVDSVTGACMLVRREAIDAVGLLDERFFMYGEDLDWAKRIKDAGWEIWYNGEVEITHVKEAASRQSSKARIDFYEAMWLFYEKHYRPATARWLEALIVLGIVFSGSLDIGKHLWRFCRPDKHKQ